MLDQFKIDGRWNKNLADSLEERKELGFMQVE
jgi:hypothetical protein